MEPKKKKIATRTAKKSPKITIPNKKQLQKKLDLIKGKSKIKRVEKKFLIKTGDKGKTQEIVIDELKYKDLRKYPSTQLPKPESDIYYVWEIEQESPNFKFVSSDYLGILYSTKSGLILASTVPMALSFGFIFPSTEKIPITGGCPTGKFINGSARCWGLHKFSRRAAIASARRKLQEHADREARLESYGYSCPTGCSERKASSAVTVETDHGSTMEIALSIPSWVDGKGTIYQGYVDYDWWALIRCT